MSVEPRVTPVPAAAAEIERIYSSQQARRAAMAATTARERIDRIRRLHDALLERRNEIADALWADFRKPAAEVDLSEVLPVVTEARHAMRHLRRWMKPQRVSTPLTLLGSRSRIVYQPKGVVLVISPWNFPINLTLGPFVSAIAAGNCAILKPSEMTPNASACMKRIVGDLFDESEAAVVEGDAGVAEMLLRRKFDHIFFTGSSAVGKIVMHAAAETLASVTLELGGKSPVIVDRSADLDEAAKKIAWGKFLNSGQICIAPDYVLVDESVREAFLARMQPLAEHSGLMVNDRHAQRMKRLFDDAITRGARIVTGGLFEGRRIAPTVIDGVAPDSALMREEIFGPILPVISYRTIDEALRVIGERDRPLVLYIFSRSRSLVRSLIARTRAGGTVVNDTLLHFFQVNLPFGGVGESGVGKAHGRFGFEAFSNARAVLEQPSRFSGIQLFYPPYTELKRKLIDFTVKYL